MPRTARPSLFAAIALLVVAVLAGCGAATEKAAEKAAEQAIESQTGGDVDIDTDGDGSVEIETDEGSASFGTGELPEEWPSDIGLPDGLEILTGSTTDTSDGRLVSVTGTIGTSPNDLLESFKEQLSGWELTSESSTTSDTGDIAAGQWEGDGRQLTLAANTVLDDGTSLTITHVDRG